MAWREVDGCKAAENSLVVGIAVSDASPAGVFLQGKSAMVAGCCVSKIIARTKSKSPHIHPELSEETYDTKDFVEPRRITAWEEVKQRIISVSKTRCQPESTSAC
jgi:hypothetical protein